MLHDDLAGRDFRRNDHYMELPSLLEGRSQKAIEYKLMNITAVLQGMGELWIDAYKPMVNFQKALVEVVKRHVEIHRESLLKAALASQSSLPAHMQEIEVNPPATFSDKLAPDVLGGIHRVAQDFDVAARDRHDQKLEKDGERRVFEREKRVLRKAGLDSLADKVVWVSRDVGGEEGYDIESYSLDERRRLIKVKTTNGWERTPFHVTRNEREVSRERHDEWCLFRLWDFSRKPKAFELTAAELEMKCDWTATDYRVRLKDTMVRNQEI